ncbi:hypothetical protein BU15DRAFT_56839, partial [Melanogaster broomeanus]
MAYSTVLNNGTRIPVPILAVDGRNWTTYHDKLLRLAINEDLLRTYGGVDKRPVNAMSYRLKEWEQWEQRNATTKQYIAATIPDTLFTRLKHLETAHECYQYLSSLFETK